MPDEPLAAESGHHQDGAAAPSTESAGGTRGRIIAGLVFLVIGLVVAGIAFLGRDDDGSSASAPDGASTTTSAAADTTPVVPIGPQAPTTIPGGELPTGCGTWDPAFSFDPDPVEGVAIYSDFDGWHVRLGPDGPASVTGAVVGQGVPVLTTDPLPAGVEVTPHPAGNALLFTLTAGAEPVGFDFGATCGQKQLTFTVDGPDGAPVPADAIQVGRAGFVTSVPVVAQRTPKAPS